MDVTSMIRRYPDPVLRQPAEPVTIFDGALRSLLDEMTVVMHEADGVGLAAPQVGISRQVVVVYDGEKDRLYRLINPEIIASSGVQVGEEGCLSFPGVFGQVKRPMKVTVRCQDETGAHREYEAEGFLARAFVHEIDHLHGRLLLDNFSPLKREMVRKKMEAL